MSQAPNAHPSPQRVSVAQKRDAHANRHQRAQWSSEHAFVLSMAAAAVGLGNLWRFPYVAGETGGAAFILAYLVVLGGLGLPLMMLEIASGRLAHGSTVGTFRGVTPAGTAYGWFVVGLTAAISSYYLVITGWTLGYFVNSIAALPPRFAAFTEGFAPVWWFFAVLGLCAAALLRGVTVIERFSKILIPVLLALVAGLTLRSAGGPGWDRAVAFLLAWEPAALGRAHVWYAAAGQAFFTLALGQGYLVTYGSYIPQRTNVPLAALIVTALQVAVALMAGLMLFPLVFAQGMDPAGGSKIAFEALPAAFAEMAAGRWLAPLFFGLFFAAAVSSCLAGLKVVVAALAEERGWSDLRAVAVTAGAMAVLGLPSALSYSALDLAVGGTPILDLIDQLGGTNVVLVSGVMGAGLLCWYLSADRVSRGLASRARWWTMTVLVVGRLAPAVGAAILAWRAAAT